MENSSYREPFDRNRELIERMERNKKSRTATLIANDLKVTALLAKQEAELDEKFPTPEVSPENTPCKVRKHGRTRGSAGVVGARHDI